MRVAKIKLFIQDLLTWKHQEYRDIQSFTNQYTELTTPEHSRLFRGLPSLLLLTILGLHTVVGRGGGGRSLRRRVKCTCTCVPVSMSHTRMV